ncbi:MAG TPA: hypothetical protein VNJ08_07970 [Bacteriovoracaceae bacterium]|nr:hypothetical protein [Bacteriovoracaceae bacterium]
MLKLVILLSFLSHAALAQDLPSKYTELLNYVQVAPDQGDTNTCLFVASTGAMELIANKKHGITNPKPYGPYDLAESYIIHAPSYQTSGKSFWETPVMKFNKGYGIHFADWPFDAWNDSSVDNTIWNSREWRSMKKVELPKVTTSQLFIYGNRWSTNVLNDSHIEKIKAALYKNKAPVLVNYNDNYYWHVVLIVGYDDNLPGKCYELSDSECKEQKGSFYVRDSFGISVEVRDYDWFRVKGNAAFVIKEANEN